MGTVTVDGQPLGEFLEQQKSAEIQEVRASENRPPRRHIITKRRSLARTRKFPGYLYYRADQKEQKVIIKNQVFSWLLKGPFPRKNFTTLGAVEMTEDESAVKCGECGQWVEAIDVHVKVHGLTAEGYRDKYGLRRDAKLCSRTAQNKRKRNIQGRPFTSETASFCGRLAVAAKASARESRIKLCGRPQAETDNARLRCEAQRFQDIKNLAKKLKRTPTLRELDAYVNPKNGLHTLDVRDLEDFFEVPIRQILLRAGLNPRIPRYQKPCPIRGMEP